MIPVLSHRDYHPIGTIGYIKGIKVKVMPGGNDPCRRCAFNNIDCIGFICSPNSRRDKVVASFKIID